MIAFTDLTKLYGLEQYHTGGGCTALTAAWETGPLLLAYYNIR